MKQVNDCYTLHHALYFSSLLCLFLLLNAADDRDSHYINKDNKTYDCNIELKETRISFAKTYKKTRDLVEFSIRVPTA